MREQVQSKVDWGDDPLLFGLELPLKKRYYPLGFPVLVESNSKEVLECLQESWSGFEPGFEESPVHLSVVVRGEGSTEPSPPVIHCRRHLMSISCDAANFCACDLRSGYACSWITRRMAADRPYLRDAFTDAPLLMMLHARHLAAVHGACVVREGMGVLLCGPSGAGKSSLALACALRGWTLITDDASFLVRKLGGRTVVGNPFVMRFKPEAEKLLSVLSGRVVQPRSSRKQAIQVRTAEMPCIAVSTRTQADYIIFLRRSAACAARLVRRSGDAWLDELRIPIYGDERCIAEQEATLEGLAGAKALDLHYSGLDAAVDCLEGLVHHGA